MNRYKYRPLKDDKPIRLLHIECGHGSDPILCGLIHTSLLNRPIYEALSYTWGSAGSPEKIYCDGYEVFVQRNLYAALVRFRRKHRSRVLWIDALCINQDDCNEKTQQIMLMADIYRQAYRGLIWLGEESDEDRTAFETLHLLKAFFNWYETVVMNSSLQLEGRSLPLHTPIVQAKLREMNITREQWCCLNRFFQRPWFRRVWVIQEIVFVANTRMPPLVACGNIKLSWEEVAKVAEGIVSLGFHFLYGDGGLQHLGHTAIRLMNQLRHSSGDSPSRRILTLLNFTRESGATDPRDKVFALYGLLGHEEANDPLLLPDYSKNVTDVYTNVAIQILRRTGPLHLLQSLPWTLPQCGGFGGILGLPSWVPDWSRRHVVPSLPPSTFCTGGRERSEFRIYDTEKVLLIKGRVVDRLRVLMHPDKIVRDLTNGTGEDWQLQFEAVQRFKRGWYRCCLSACQGLSGISTREEFPFPSNHHRYPTGESLQEAFWRTLICNMDMQRRKVGPEYRNYWLHLHRLYSRLGDIWDNQQSTQIKLDMMTFEEPMGLFAEGRRFCTTVNGYMGWVPQQAQQGDMLCILKGVGVPFLLRRAFFKHGDLPFLIRPGAVYYQIIGECYIHGIMEGELTEKKDVKWADVMLR